MYNFKLLLGLTAIWLATSVGAQTVTNINVATDNSYGVGNWRYISPNFYTNTDIGQHLSASYTAGTSNWFFYSGASVIFYTTNTPAVPANGAIYQLYTNGAVYYVLGMPVQAQFSNSLVNDLVISSNTLSSFWATSGSSVRFFASGYNNSSANSNVLKCSLGTNNVFTSPPTAGRGSPWRLSGVLSFDGTNMTSSVQYASGDTNQPLIPAFGIITNAPITNQSFTVALGGGFDTNLTLQAGSIYSTVVLPPAVTPASLSLVPASPGFWLIPGTITSSTNSSFGFGAGLLCWDTNYLYLTVGTNLWKRAALTSW